MGTREHYPTDLSDAAWAAVRRSVPAPKRGGRPPKYERREIINGLNYMIRGGGPWRSLPPGLPPWGAVYWYFRTWKRDGTFDRLARALDAAAAGSGGACERGAS
jgi:transposase